MNTEHNAQPRSSMTFVPSGTEPEAMVAGKVTGPTFLDNGKVVDEDGREHPNREAYDAYVTEAARVADIAAGKIGDNEPKPQSKAKYIPTETDAAKIKANLKTSLADMNRAANTMESRGVPYLLGLADYAVNHRVERLEWPDKEKLRKFLRESGAEPGKESSTYTKTIVNQAVNLVKFVTSAEFPVYLGYRHKADGKTAFTVEKPEDGTEFTRTLLAPSNLISPKVRAGKEFIDNPSTALLPITFNVGNKLLTKLTKGAKVREPRAGGNDGANPVPMVDTIKSYGPEKLCEAMGEFITGKDVVPTRENIAAPFELATAVMGKVNAAFPDRIPENMLNAMLALKAELDERFELVAEGADAGSYRIVSVDGLNSYVVNPETLPE